MEDEEDQRGGCTGMKWRAVTGDCRAVTEALDRKGRHSLWASARFLDALLRGYGQVLLCNNPITGIVIVAALLYVDLQACLWSLCTGTLGLSVSIIIKQEVGEIRAGLTTFNCVLVGMVSASNFPVFFGRYLSDEPIFVVVVLIATVVCVFLTSALTRLFSQLNGLPSLAVPFASTQGMLFILIAQSALNPITTTTNVPTLKQVPVVFEGSTNFSDDHLPFSHTNITLGNGSFLSEMGHQPLIPPELSINGTVIQGVNQNFSEDLGDQEPPFKVDDVRFGESNINGTGTSGLFHKPQTFKADDDDDSSIVFPPSLMDNTTTDEGRKPAPGDARLSEDADTDIITSNLESGRQPEVDLEASSAAPKPLLGFTLSDDPLKMLDDVPRIPKTLEDLGSKLFQPFGLLGVNLPQDDTAPNDSGTIVVDEDDGDVSESTSSRRKRSASSNTTVEMITTEPTARSGVDWGELFGGVLKAPTQAFGVSSAPGGAAMYFAVVLSSPATAVAMALGGTVGSLVAVGLVSAPYDALYDGSWTFNSLLTCGVLAGLLFVPSPISVAVGVVGAIFCVVVIVALNPIVALVPMPYMSIPFNLVTLLMLCVATPGNTDALVRPENPSCPEENYRQLRRTRRQRNRELGQQAIKSEETEKLAPLAQAEHFMESV